MSKIQYQELKKIRQRFYELVNHKLGDSVKV